MNSKQDNELISLGFQLGLRTASGLFLGGLPVDENGLNAMRITAENELYKMTGSPPEDLFKPENIKDLGHGKGYCLSYNDVIKLTDPMYIGVT